MTPKSRTWKVNKYTGIEGRRTGFCTLPDFATTAHIIQGATLEACFVDAQETGSKVNMALQIAAYVGFSRIKELCRICVLQAFSPFLFARGPPKGPARLLRKLSGAITSEEALEEWVQEDDSMPSEDVANAGDPMKEKYRCASCYLSGATEYLHSPQKFGITTRTAVYTRYVCQGSWTRCLACQKKHNIILATSSSHSVQQSSTSHSCATDS